MTATASCPYTSPPPTIHPSILTCPDDSDFLDSDAEGDDAAHDLRALQPGSSQQRSRWGTSPEAEAYDEDSEEAPVPEMPLVYISNRFYFTYFAGQPPSKEQLNAGSGAESAYFEEPKPQRSMADVEEPATLPERFHWFNIDDDLVYLSFFEDWGPLNIGLFYRFCMHVHQMLQDDDLSDRVLVMYTSNDPCKKANGSLLAAMYSMIVDRIEPADAFHPFSRLEFRPFRDAGYGRADYYLTMQDVLYGVHRAIKEELLDLSEFNLDEYEFYEQVHNGDWNWITPSFLAFASPNDREYVAALKANGGVEPSSMGRKLPQVFKNTVRYFKERNIKLVVRLNNPLYDKAVFEEAGIAHLDLYFDDGSNPSNEILREFIRRADDVIRKGGALAIHCKAGLGRTGVLIGAYLIWKYGFSASEVIGFMRIMRPGCVVGPQQHFMYQNFADWIRWGVQDMVATERKAIEDAKAMLAHKGLLEVSRIRNLKRPSTPEVFTSDDESDAAPVTPRAAKLPHVAPATVAPAVKPTPCVGQPRKSPSPTRKRTVQAAALASGRSFGAAIQSHLSNSDMTTSTSRDSVSSSEENKEPAPAPGTPRRSLPRATPTSPNGGVASLREGWEARTTPRANRVRTTEEVSRTPTVTASGGRVLTEAQRWNHATTTPEGGPSSPKVDSSAKLQPAVDIKASPARIRGHERSRSDVPASSSADPDSDVFGVIGSPPASTATAGPASPVIGSPRSQRVPSFKASPHVKAAYGLKDSKVEPGSPSRSPKLNASEESVMASSTSGGSQQSDAEVLNILGLVDGREPLTVKQAGSKVAAATTATATRPALRTFGRTPSSSNSISPAKIRGLTTSASNTAPAIGMRNGTRVVVSSSAGPSSSAAASRVVPGSSASRPYQRTTSGSSQSGRPTKAPATSRAAPSAVNGNAKSLSSDGATTGNRSVRTAVAPSSRPAPSSSSSEHSGRDLLSSTASSNSLKRSRPSPDVDPVTGGEWEASSRRTKLMSSTSSNTSTTASAMRGKVAPIGSHTAARSRVAGLPPSGHGGGVSTATNATTTSGGQAEAGRNVRPRRSSLGAADIGLS